VLVLEDGSTDQTADVARSFEPAVRFIQKRPACIGGARNAAVRRATGEYVAFLDADDLWEPDKLERQVQAFEADRSLDFGFTYAQEFASPEDAARYAVRPKPLVGAIASGLFARRGAIERAGGFDEDVTVGELLGWLARARELDMNELTLDGVLVRRRIHSNNMTRRLRAEFGDYARVLKRSLDRRRASV
jgi:glycosyltransferase involved in cell wall biosynthesis